MNDFYNHAGYPATNSTGSSANMRAELDLIAAGFDKLPPLAGNALKSIRVNAAGTALEASNAVTIPVTSYVLKGDGAGGMSAGTPGTDYLVPAAIGVTVQAYDATILKSAAIGVTVQGYDATTLKSADIGSTVQAYDADTMKSDVETDITGAMTHTPSSLTDGANIDWNLDTQQNATVTLGGNRVMNAPSNAKAGRFVALRVVQDGTGGRTLTFASAYKGMTGITPVTTASAVNFYLFRCIDTTNLALVGFRSNCEA